MANQCILDGCEYPRHSRGLCSTDYGTALRAVTDGETTWRELEQAGLALPSKLRSGKLRNLLLKQGKGRK